MTDEPPAPPPVVAETAAPAAPVDLREPEGRVVIDLTRLLPPPPAAECVETSDPFTSEIVVCAAITPAPRLGPMVGPVDDGFASAIPRARIKLSDTASAEANLINQSVGGFDADGAEVRVKIGF
jgi:hypothetical protein